MIKEKVDEVNALIVAANLIEVWGGYCITEYDKKKTNEYGVSPNGKIYQREESKESVGYLYLGDITSKKENHMFHWLYFDLVVNIFVNPRKLGNEVLYFETGLKLYQLLASKYDTSIKKVRIEGQNFENIKLNLKFKEIVSCNYVIPEKAEIC